MAKRVIYHRLFSFGKYENERIGFEEEIDDSVDEDEVLGQLYLKVCDIEDVLQTYRDRETSGAPPPTCIGDKSCKKRIFTFSPHDKRKALNPNLFLLKTLNRNGVDSLEVCRRYPLKEKVPVHCIGCGVEMLWPVGAIMAYTCRCGAHIFVANQTKHQFLPASFVLALTKNKPLCHIDYYIGFSNYMSEEKEKVYQFLKDHGAIWSWNCKKCKGRFLKRKRMEVKEGLIRFELHPSLKTLL